MSLPGWTKFALVGGTGFAVDCSLFSLLTVAFGLDPYCARAAAFVAAASTTWWGNRCFTFAERLHGRARSQWLRAFTAALLSALPNFVVFGLVLELCEGWRFGPWLALVAGIAVGTLSNYALSSLWVFRSRVES